jgi:hypothetical protein
MVQCEKAMRAACNFYNCCEASVTRQLANQYSTVKRWLYATAFVHSIAGLPLSTRAKKAQLALRFSELSTAFNAAFQSNVSKDY